MPRSVRNLQRATCKIVNQHARVAQSRKIVKTVQRGTRDEANGIQIAERRQTDSFTKFISRTLDYFEASPNEFALLHTHFAKSCDACSAGTASYAAFATSNGCDDVNVQRGLMPAGPKRIKIALKIENTKRKNYIYIYAQLVQSGTSNGIQAHTHIATRICNSISITRT